MWRRDTNNYYFYNNDNVDNYDDYKYNIHKHYNNEHFVNNDDNGGGVRISQPFALRHLSDGRRLW